MERKVEVKKRSWEIRYDVIGELNGLPKGAENVLVQYDESGKVTSIFYSRKYPGTSDVEELKRKQKELEEMNSRVQTQEEKEKIAGLLKRLSEK